MGVESGTSVTPDVMKFAVFFILLISLLCVAAFYVDTEEEGEESELAWVDYQVDSRTGDSNNNGAAKNGSKKGKKGGGKGKGTECVGEECEEGNPKKPKKEKKTK